MIIGSESRWSTDKWSVVGWSVFVFCIGLISFFPTLGRIFCHSSGLIEMNIVYVNIANIVSESSQ